MSTHPFIDCSADCLKLCNLSRSQITAPYCMKDDHFDAVAADDSSTATWVSYQGTV